MVVCFCEWFGDISGYFWVDVSGLLVVMGGCNFSW